MTDELLHYVHAPCIPVDELALHYSDDLDRVTCDECRTRAPLTYFLEVTIKYGRGAGIPGVGEIELVSRVPALEGLVGRLYPSIRTVTVVGWNMEPIAGVGIIGQEVYDYTYLDKWIAIGAARTAIIQAHQSGWKLPGT